MLNGGEKSTTGDGVWGELVIKTNGDTFAKATNLSYLALPAMNVVVDKAQINFGPAYVGITAGDTEVGKLKMDAAVKSADSDNAVTLASVGSKNYTQGITIGYKNDMFNVAADVRSYAESEGVWRLDYVPAGYPDEKKIALPGSLYGSEDEAKAAKEEVEEYYKGIGTTVDVSITKIGNYYENADQYSHKYAMALEGEFTGVENLSVKAGVSYDFGTLQGESKGFDVDGDGKADITVGKAATLGYSTSAGYKLALNDTFYVRPQVGFAGTSVFGEDIPIPFFYTIDTGSVTTMNMVTGVLFGWGDTADAHPGVYYMDDDDYKKVTPGVSVVVNMPLVYSLSGKAGDNKMSADLYAGTGKFNGEKQDWWSLSREITITPSFYSGEIIPGLTSAVYSNIGIVTQKDFDTKVKFDIAAAAKYAIPVAAGTITPQVGVKYANANANEGKESLSTKIGVDVAGFVANTTFFTVYDSGNFLAKDEAGKSEPSYGTLNFGAKISF